MGATTLHFSPSSAQSPGARGERHASCSTVPDLLLSVVAGVRGWRRCRGGWAMAPRGSCHCSGQHRPHPGSRGFQCARAVVAEARGRRSWHQGHDQTAGSRLPLPPLRRFERRSWHRGHDQSAGSSVPVPPSQRRKNAGGGTGTTTGRLAPVCACRRRSSARPRSSSALPKTEQPSARQGRLPSNGGRHAPNTPDAHSVQSRPNSALFLITPPLT